MLLSLGFTPEQERLIWLAGSVLLYVGIKNIVWVTRPVLGRVVWSAAASIGIDLFRFIFYVGIPYVALLNGVVTLRSLGLVPAPAGEAFNQGMLLAAGALALMGLIGWHYRREVLSLSEGVASPFVAVGQFRGRPWGWVEMLLAVVYQQVHWAFYRALPLLILDDAYVGGFLGLALVLLEAYADPHMRRDLADPARADFLLLSAGFAVVSTVLFVVTGTSWLGAGVHLLFVMGWVVLLRARHRLRAHEP